MLRKLAAALVAVTMITAPVLAGVAQAAPATTAHKTVKAKHGAKFVKKHRKTVRHALHAKRINHVKHMTPVHAKKTATHGKARHHA
jgi:uncharacterized membrane protein